MEPNIQKPNNTNIDVSTEHKRNDYSGEEIDLLNVLKNMKATKKYIWLVVAFFLLGAGVAGVLSYFSPRAAVATSLLTYNFEEINKENGTEQEIVINEENINYDIISSQYIISKALEKTEINPMVKSKLNASDIAEALTVNRIFSDATLQKISNLNLINDQNRLVGTDLANFNYEYSNQMVVTLKGMFALSQRELTALLNNIIVAYNEYLITEYFGLEIPTNYLANIDITGLEYSDAIENIEMQLDVLKEFCDTNTYYGDYRLSTNGRSLVDIAKLIEFVQNEDLVYVKSFIHENGVTNDPERALALFEYQLMNLQYDYDELLENIESNRRLIENYKNDVNTVLNSGTQVEAGISVTDYYNSIITRQQKNYEKKVLLISKIQNTKDMIAKVSSSNVRQNKKNQEYVSNEMEAIYKKTTELYDMVYNQVNEMIDSNQSNSSFISVVPAQYNQLSFLSAATIKKILTYSFGGAFLAVVIWLATALFTELSQNKQAKKEEKEYE